MQNALKPAQILLVFLSLILALAGCTAYSMGGMSIDEYTKERQEIVEENTLPEITATPAAPMLTPTETPITPAMETLPVITTSTPTLFSAMETIETVDLTEPTPTSMPTATSTPAQKPAPEVEITTSTVKVTPKPADHSTHDAIDGLHIVELTEKTCVLFSCTLDEQDVVVPNLIDGYSVVGIGSNCFNGLKNTSEIALPDTVEYIESTAFTNCPELVSIHFGTGLKTIGSRAITNCKSLDAISFPDGITDIGNMVVDNCEALKSVYIPESATKFGGVIAYTQTCPNIIIVTPSGSTAESVAAQSELPTRAG